MQTISPKRYALATSTGYAGRRPLPWLACNVARALCGAFSSILHHVKRFMSQPPYLDDLYTEFEILKNWEWLPRVVASRGNF